MSEEISKIWKWEEINLQKISKLQETHNIYVVAQDKRDKSYKQIRFMYAILKEFAIEYYGTPDKSTIEELKYAFYADFEKAHNLEAYRTVTASVSQMKVFLDWLIKTLAIDFCFSISLDLVEEEFKTQWIYANTCARICCITGKAGADICHVSRAVGMGRNRNKIDHTKFKVISLGREYHTEEHAEPDFLKERGLYGVTLSEFDFNRLGVRGKFEVKE
jgi:Protein of unknown function (DUF968).